MTVEQSRIWHDWEPVVESLAREIFVRFGGRVELDDLRQAGLLELAEQIARVDRARADTRSRYLSVRLRGAIFDQARREVGRVPHHRVMGLDEAARRFAKGPPGVEPRDADAPVHLTPFGEPLADGRPTISTAWQGGRRSMESEIMFREFVRSLRGRLARLEARERTAIRGHDLGGKPLARVGDRLGLSKAGATRLRHRALAKLRAAVEA